MSVFDIPGWKTGRFNNETYHYLYVKPNSKDKKTFIFFPGFPTGVLSYRKIVSRAIADGHGVVLTEMLGFGGTSHPKEAEKYSRIAIADAVAEILAVEGVEKGVVIGHDWGVPISSRFVLKHPNLSEGLVQLGFPFVPPENNPKPLDVPGYNAAFKDLVGYEPLAYMLFFVTDRAPRLLSEHTETFLRCMFDARPNLSSAYTFCDVDVLETNLKLDRQPPIPYWATEQASRPGMLPPAI
ncbi:alpha/beta-hydrolase [Clavulina sp. PMI_390]|nr:alpha/beta-hydrolase [Clavulina sp. PMI_390]